MATDLAQGEWPGHAEHVAPVHTYPVQADDVVRDRLVAVLVADHGVQEHLLDSLAVQRRERARIRSEKGSRWGGRPLTTAA